MDKKTLAQIASICEDLGGKFKCQICLDQLKNPVKLKCRHRFCRMCIEQHIRTKSTHFVENSPKKFSKVFCPLLCDEKNQVTKRNLVDDLESPPLQKAVTSLAKIMEISFEVKDLQQVREPPVSKREAPSPSIIKSKRRILDLSSSPSSLKTRSSTSKPSDESDFPKTRNRKLNLTDAEVTGPILSATRTSKRVSLPTFKLLPDVSTRPTSVSKNKDGKASMIGNNSKASKNDDNKISQKPNTPKKKSSMDAGHKQSTTLSKQQIMTSPKKMPKKSPKKMPNDSIKDQNIDVEGLNESSGEDQGRSSYSIEFKLQIVEEAKVESNNTQVARNHGISEASVRYWRKNEDKLRNAVTIEPQAGPSSDNKIFKKPNTPRKKSYKTSIQSQNDKAEVHDKSTNYEEPTIQEISETTNDNVNNSPPPDPFPERKFPLSDSEYAELQNVETTTTNNPIENQTDDFSDNTTNELLSLTSKIKAHTIATLIDLGLPSSERCSADELDSEKSQNQFKLNPRVGRNWTDELDSEKFTEELKHNSQDYNLMPTSETGNFEETIEELQKVKNTNHPKLKSQKEIIDLPDEQHQEEYLQENTKITTQQENKSIEASPIFRSPRKSSRIISRQLNDSISNSQNVDQQSEKNEINNQKPRFSFKIGSNLRSPNRSKRKLTDDNNENREEKKQRMQFKFFKAGRLCPTKERNVIELENYSQIEKKQRLSSNNDDDGGDNTIDFLNCEFCDRIYRGKYAEVTLRKHIIEVHEEEDPEISFKKSSQNISHQINSQNDDKDDENIAISQNETMLEDLCPVIRRDNETEEIFDSTVIPSSLEEENQATNINSDSASITDQWNKDFSTENISAITSTEIPKTQVDSSYSYNTRRSPAKPKSKPKINDNLPKLILRRIDEKENCNQNRSSQEDFVPAASSGTSQISKAIMTQSQRFDSEDFFHHQNSGTQQQQLNSEEKYVKMKSVSTQNKKDTQNHEKSFQIVDDEEDLFPTSQPKKSSMKRKRSLLQCQKKKTNTLVEKLDEHEMKGMVLANSGLKVEDRQKFYEFTEKYKFGAIQTSMEDKPKVTHLIVNHTEDMCGDRTMKFLQAISKRIWIIGIKWVQDSLSCGTCLLPEQYEVKDIHNLPGPSRARTLGKRSRLFEGFEVCLKGFFPGPLQKEVLRQFLVDEGANTCIKISSMEFSNRKNVTIVDSDADTVVAEAEREFKMYSVITLSKDWLIDCLSSFQILKIDSYTKIEITSEQMSRINNCWSWAMPHSAK